MKNFKKDNIQVYPSKKRIVPNFKLVKIAHNLSDAKYNGMVINGNFRSIVEKKNHTKNGDDVITVYKIANSEGYDNTDPLTEFDRAVLSVCISEFDVGNLCTTPAIILRGLTGKVGKSGAEIFPNQRLAIMTSITKLMQTTIQIDDTNTNEQLNYQQVQNSKETSNLLPAHYIEKTVNGKDATVIYFDRESPFMKIGRSRKQLLTFDARLLDVPKQNNTPMNITIKNYAMNRVQEIKLHKLQPILTFDDIFKKCRVENAGNKTKMDARNTVIKFFEHLKNESEIKAFEITKKGNSFYSIKFSYSKKVLRLIPT